MCRAITKQPGEGGKSLRTGRAAESGIVDKIGCIRTATIYFTDHETALHFCIAHMNAEENRIQFFTGIGIVCDEPDTVIARRSKSVLGRSQVTHRATV